MLNSKPTGRVIAESKTAAEAIALNDILRSQLILSRYLVVTNLELSASD
jgi:hypothetical protein